MESFKVICDHCSTMLVLKVRSRLGTEVSGPNCREWFVAHEVGPSNALSEPDAEYGGQDLAEPDGPDSTDDISDDEPPAQAAAFTHGVHFGASRYVFSDDPVDEEDIEEIAHNPAEAGDLSERMLSERQSVATPEIEAAEGVEDDETYDAGEIEFSPIEAGTTAEPVVKASPSRMAACYLAMSSATSAVSRYCQTQQFRAIAVSLGVHTLLCLFLAVCVISGAAGNFSDYVVLITTIEASQDESFVSHPQEALAVEVGKSEPALMPAAIVSRVTDVTPDLLESIEVPEMEQQKAAPNAVARPSQAAKKKKPIKRLMSGISKRGTAVRGPLLTEPDQGVTQSDTAQAAAGGVFGQLQSAAGDNRPLHIIWLMDASLSLVAEREVLAPQVKSFYENLLSSNSGDKRVINSAVLAFGATTQQVVSNSRSPDGIARAIRNLPIDTTGVENVMSAVTNALNSVAQFKGRVEIVVWTDESGDDLQYLEEVIALCRQRKARVHVIGPLSVFGMEPGLQKFQMPPPHRYRVLLPVKRGPDSAFPERARLPFWYGSTDRPWSGNKLISDDGEFANLGGPLRHRLLAGTGPYGLTRLALATGGLFTALKRDGDLAPPDRERYVKYLPDYRSALEIAADIESHPLRQAIIEAAALTWQIDYWPPRLSFPESNSDNFPYSSFSYYVTPAVFQTTLERDLRLEFERLQKTQILLDQAIEIMTSANSVRADRAGDQESLRWQAWYDLNLGRLLAHSVRIAEYLNLAEKLMQNDLRAELFQRGMNQLRISGSSNLSTGRAGLQREKEARERLERVIRDHADTPWSQMAIWELEHEFGCTFQTSIIPPPKPVRFVPFTPSLPAPQIPRL